MRLMPPVTTTEALAMLRANAVIVWGAERAVEIDATLQNIAQAMEVVSHVDVPEDIEPLVGENPGDLE